MRKFNRLTCVSTLAAVFGFGLCTLAQNTYWLPESGNWSDAENWSAGLPGTANETYFGLYSDSFQGPKTATITEDEAITIGLLQIGYGQAATFAMQSGSSLSLQGSGVATVGMLRGTNGGASSLRIVATDAARPSTFNAVNIRIGGHASGSDGSSLEFNGVGLRANLTGDLRIGQFKNSNSVTVSGGSQLSGLTVKVGWATNRNNANSGNNNSLVVDGTGTNATFAGNGIVMNVGSTSTGDTSAVTGNRVDVTGGATLRVEGKSSSAAVSTAVGNYRYAQSNSVNVTGAGSRFELGGNMTLAIGSAEAENGGNYVSAGAGGIIKNEGSVELTGNSATANYLRIAAGGSYVGGKDINNTGGVIYLDDGGSLTGESASGTATAITINLRSNAGGSSSRMYVEGAGLGSTVGINAQSGSVLAVGRAENGSVTAWDLNSQVSMDAGSTLEFTVFSASEAASINLGANGTISGSTTMAIVFAGYTPVGGEQWVLFSGNTAGIDSSFSLSSFLLPTLGGGLSWDVSRLNADGGWILGVVVPEPKSGAAVMLALVLLAGQVARRRFAGRPAK